MGFLSKFRTTASSAILGVVLGIPTLARGDDSFRCGTHLVQLGDTSQLVEQVCGRPTDVHVAKTKIRGSKGAVVTVEEETWTYELGRFQFLRRLVFSNGVVRSITATEYGTK